MSTKTGSYSAGKHGDPDSNRPGHAKTNHVANTDKARRVAIGPAEGVVPNAYVQKDFTNTIDANSYLGAGAIKSGAGRVVPQKGAFNSGRQDVSADLSDKFLGKRRSPGKWE